MAKNSVLNKPDKEVKKPEVSSVVETAEEKPVVENLAEAEEEKIEDLERPGEPEEKSTPLEPKASSEIGTSFVSGESSGGWGTVFNKKTFLIALAVILGLGLVGGGIFVYKKALGEKGITSSEEQPTTEPTAIIAETATPEPEEEEALSPTPTTAELKRKDLKIQVLNGSGVADTAGKAKEFLEGLGYEEVEAGNADSYDYEKTKIAIKEARKDYLDLLKEDLAEKYTLAEKTETLDKDSDFDAVVTIGKK